MIMKQTKIKKIASVLVVIAVLVCALAGISASAVTEGEIQVSAKIESVNVEHRGCMHLAFKVETASAPDGAVIGIMIWNKGVTNYTAQNSIWSNYELSNDGAGTDYYASMPIAAKNIATQYKVAVVAELDGEVTLLSVPVCYSIMGWAETKLADPNTTDPARINLYEKVIAYGKAASAVLSK